MKPPLPCRLDSLRSLTTRCRAVTSLSPRLQAIRIAAPPSKRTFSDSSLLYPDAPTSEHHDLASFNAYAERTGLDMVSPTAVGTHFEYTVAAALAPLGFRMKRVGGRSDAGIDHLGTWTIPSSISPMRVILQCKVASRRTLIGPRIIRELEGTFTGAPPGWRGSGVLGILVAQKPATKGMRDALGRSRWPMGFICCSREGDLKQILWNQKADEKGLEGMGVAVQFPQGSTQDNPRLVLTWKGRPYKAETPPAGEGGSTVGNKKQLA